MLQVHDRMTEEVYKQPLRSFKTDVTPAPVYTVPLLEKGRAALEEINEELGLGFDEWDKDYYLNMFTQDLQRDPTSVELFDMAQSNSEHRCPPPTPGDTICPAFCPQIPCPDLNLICFFRSVQSQVISRRMQ